MLIVGVMGAICALPLMVNGATSRVRVAPLRSSTEPAEEIVATVVALEEVAVMLPVSLSDPQRVNVNPPVEPVAFCVKITVVPSIFYGHTHVRGVFGWTGPKPAPVIAGKPLPAGIPTFNTDNAAHFSGPAQAFLYAEVHGREILVRELATTDGWKTSQWTPLAWRMPHASG